MAEPFTLKLLNLHWLDTMPAEQDLCAHGRVVAKLGDQLLSSGDTDWAVSATAPFLLRTLTTDHTPDKPVGGAQLLPCCGFTMWPDETSEDVLILGCPNGVDWWIKHQAASFVKLTAPTGASVSISLPAYRAQVLRFADQVEQFYRASPPKEVPADELDARGYELFWQEWQRRRNQWSK